MRKEKLRKVGLCFITGCFMKPFQMIINHFFYFSSSFTAQFLLFDIRDIKRENWEQQIARDCKLNIYFKNNFILLVMITLNFLNWQNVHMWHFIKIVVHTLISWSKAKNFTDYNDKIWTKNTEAHITFICFSSVKHFNNLVFT